MKIQTIYFDQVTLYHSLNILSSIQNHIYGPMNERVSEIGACEFVRLALLVHEVR